MNSVTPSARHPVALSARPIIFLIGYRGTGKSTVAKLLAEKRGWDWVDADAELEARRGRTIQQIFAAEGELGFRVMEAELLAELGTRERHVVATGGGVILREDNRARLKEGTCIWLTADADTIWQRLQVDPSTAQRRPPLTTGGKAEIDELLQRREPLYRVCADLEVSTAARSPADVVEEIESQLSASRSTGPS